mgnify:CR=1 FL=1
MNHQTRSNISGSIIAVYFKWSVNRFEGWDSWFPWGIPMANQSGAFTDAAP